MEKYECNGVDVSIPSTGDDWELFTSSMACGTASRALTSALKKALKAVDGFVHRGEKPVRAAYLAKCQYVNPVQEKYASYGAQDTEPDTNAALALMRYIAERYDAECSIWDIR